jgi:hypothetical protein
MNCHKSTSLGHRNATEPLTKLRKEGATFRGAQGQVHMIRELDGKASKGPEMAYPDLKKLPETEIGATICTPGIMPPTEDRRAQVEAIGLHSREHPPEKPPHGTTTQVDHDCNPQKDNKGTVKCDDTPENCKEKHSPREESHATSLLRRTDYRGKEQGNSATPDILRKEHAGRITIRNDWWPTTQKWSEKQAWQRTVCQDREQHTATRMIQIGRTEQCLSDSSSLTSSLENCSDTAMSTSAFTDTITALSTNSNHADEPQPQLLLIAAKTQGFQGTGISTIDKLPMDRQGPVTHHHTGKETLLPNKGTIKAPEVAAPLKEQACSLVHDVLKCKAPVGFYGST